MRNIFQDTKLTLHTDISYIHWVI